MLLKNKTAIITGCNRGIGKAILEKFAENGANIFACARKEYPEFVENIKNLAEKYNVEITPLYFDMTDSEAMKAAVTTIRKSKRQIDILVNNAGILADSNLFQMSPIENMRKTFDVNFFAQMRLTQYISRLMQKSGGSIVFISSVVALDGSPGQIGYVGSKSALIGATKTLSIELGQTNIRVNAVAPGIIETDMGDELNQELAQNIIERSALKRRGTPAEVANTVLFLASDLSNYITGQYIRVDGGAFAGIGRGGVIDLDVDKIYSLAKKMRLSVIETGYSAGGKNGAHFGGALSAIEILACLYGGVMNKDDCFILSKAHGCLALYVALAHTGHFPLEDLKTFEQNESELGGHPVMNPARGIEFSGGSLGMGLSQGVGVALGFKRKNLDSRVFVLLGDGECDEGSVWEGIMSAAHFKLDNLIVIVDKNKLQSDGETSSIMDLQDLAAKFESFGFDTYEVDGHDISALCNAFNSTINKNSRPKVIVANTIKGKGVSFMENQFEWHHKALTEQQYKDALAEVK